ncbi:MAG: hypothetical protein AAFP90_22710, partial [Planctomycetota bacterium]
WMVACVLVVALCVPSSTRGGDGQTIVFESDGHRQHIVVTDGNIHKADLKRLIQELGETRAQVIQEQIKLQLIANELPTAATSVISQPSRKRDDRKPAVPHVDDLVKKQAQDALAFIGTTAEIDSFTDPACTDDQGLMTQDPGLGTLSVPPSTATIYPKTRPLWLNNEPFHDDGDRLILTAVTPLMASAQGSEEVLPNQVHQHLVDYVTANLGSDKAGYVDPTWGQRLIDESPTLIEYKGTAISGGEEQHESAVQIQVSKRVLKRLDRSWRNNQVSERLALVATLLVLGLMTGGVARFGLGWMAGKPGA